MLQRFQIILAISFMLQIALPCTTPLPTCDVGDLLGTKPQQGASGAPDAGTTTPLAGEAESDASSCRSPVQASVLRASTALAAVPQLAMSGLLRVTFDLSPSPQVQQTVLRV